MESVSTQDQSIVNVLELKAEAYDTLVALEQHQSTIENYIKETVTPLKNRLAEINKSINEARSSNTSVQGQ